MLSITSQSVGLLCRPVKHNLIYGRALSYVPARTSNYFSFRVMKLEPIQNNDGILSSDVEYSIQYKLVETPDIVEASNTGNFAVHQGSNVVLTQSIVNINTYDVYCECSQGRFGIVIEPSIGMLYPLESPNFTGCDNDGFPYTLSEFLKNRACLNGRSAGTLAILDEIYYPLRAKYVGGETYINPKDGKTSRREAGEPCFEERYGENGDTLSQIPLYYMRRELVLDTTTHYYKKREYANDSNGDAPTYLNSPYLYQYVDGTDCAFSMPPVFNMSRGGGNSIENWQAITWKTTGNPHDAQLNYNLFLCPKQGENESIMPGALVEIIKETYAENYLPSRTGSWGMQIGSNGSSIAFPVIIPYCMVEPPVSNWYVAVDGQVKTYGIRYTRDLFIPTYEHRMCKTLQDTEILTVWDLIENFPENVLTNIIGTFQWGGQVPDTASNRTVALVMYIICDHFRGMSQDVFSFLTENSLSINTLPTTTSLSSYFDLYNIMRHICGSQKRVLWHAWFKYVAWNRMSILEEDDNAPGVSNPFYDPMETNPFYYFVRHVLRRTAHFLSEMMGDEVAIHPAEQELIMLNDKCVVDEGQAPSSFMVKCLLKTRQPTPVGGQITVQHNLGTTGEPDILSEDMVVNLKKWQPCRGSFTTVNNELVKFPNLFRILCQNGFGVPTTVHDPSDTRTRQKVHYTIQRELVDPVTQRYDLILRTPNLYKSYGQLMSYFAWNDIGSESDNSVRIES